jgi:hypothetical protein
MIKITTRVVSALAISLLALSSAQAASNNSADLLKYIPADSPYVVASTEPMPKKLADKFEPTIDQMLQAYQTVLRHLMAEQLVKMSEKEGGAEEAMRFRGLMEEVIALMSLDAIRAAGIERESAFAFYGNGLLPVVRFELSDPDLFDAAVERMEEKAGEPLLIGKAKGRPYKYIEADKINIIIATIDEQAVVTVVPSAFDEKQVALAIGADVPRQSLKKSKLLRAIGKEYGFSDYMTGYFDTRRMAGMFVGHTTAQDDAFFAAIGEPPPPVTDECAAEIMAMAGIAPRIVFGYSSMSADRIESAMIVELREDIAEGLATIPASVPGLGVDFGGLLSLGFGLNPLALRNFYEARLNAMEAKPYKCDKFAELQAGVAKGREALNQPLPPVVYSFRGFVTNISDIQGLDLASGTPPTSIDASILLAVENAESLLMMAAMMDPQIAALGLLPDGKPVKLELAQIAAIAEVAFAALSENALSVSLGEGAESNAAGMLVADSASPAPFMSMNMDTARYYSMIGDAMANEAADEEGEQMPAAVRKAMSDVVILSGSMYERMALDVQFTKRGVEINGRMTLSD